MLGSKLGFAVDYEKWDIKYDYSPTLKPEVALICAVLAMKKSVW